MSYKKKRYINKLFIMLQALIVIIILIFPIKTFALNSYNQQGKAPNLMGYKVLDDHTLQIFADKSNPMVEAAEFHIFHGTNSEGESVQINNLSVESGGNFSGLKGQLPSGSSFILTTAKGAFKPGEVYTVVINNNITYGSGSLGWFNSHTDQMISFTIPNDFTNPNNSEYSISSKAVLKSWPGNNATNIPVEGNIWITSSIPIKNYTDIQQNLVIKKNGTQLRYDNYLYTGKDTIPNNNADIFAPVISDDHNSIIIPLTVGSHTAPCYNLEQGAQYEVVIPEMQLANGQIIAKHSIVFHTEGSTVSNKFNNGNPKAIITDDSIEIDWSSIAPSSNAIANTSGVWGPAFVSAPPSGYNVYASTDKYWNYAKLNTSPITETSFDTANCGLKPNTNYYFRISALSNINVTTGAVGDTVESGFSSDISANTPIDTKAPCWPAGSKISISKITKDSIVLNWNKAQDNSGVETYRIYLNELLKDTISSNVNTYTVSGLQSDIEYNLKIEAGDFSNNWTTDGPMVSAKTLKTIPPTWPQKSSVRVSKVNGDSVQLNWTAAIDDAAVTSYKIFENGYLVGTVSADTTAYFVTGLNSDTQYIFKIEAGDGDGNWTLDGPSTTVKTKDITAPHWVDGNTVKASNITQHSLKLNWTSAKDNERVAFYKIYKDGSLIKTVDGNTTSFNITGLAADTEYYFKVEAGDDSDNWNNDGPSINCRTLDNYNPVVTSSTITSEHNSIEINSTPAIEVVKAVVYDQYRNEIPSRNITWSIDSQPIGITINQNGIITVQPFATVGTIYVKVIVNGANVETSKKFEIKMHASTNYITNQEALDAISKSLNYDTVVLPNSSGEAISIGGKALQDMNNVDKYISVSNINDVNFKFKLKDMCLGSSSLSNISQFYLGCVSVDFSTKNQMITDNSMRLLSPRSFTLAALPFKLSAGTILNDGSQQQITNFNDPVNIAMTLPLGISTLDNQVLRICRYNEDTNQWEDKGPVVIKDNNFIFTVSGFSYWAIMIETKINSNTNIGSNEIATTNKADNITSSVNAVSAAVQNKINLNLLQSKVKAKAAIDNTSSINSGDEKRNSVAGVSDSNKDARVGVKEIKAVKKVESMLSRVNWKVSLILLIILVFILRILILMINFKSKENSSKNREIE